MRNCSALPSDFYLCRQVTFCHSVKMTGQSTKVPALKQQVFNMSLSNSNLNIYTEISINLSLVGRYNHINEEQSTETGADHQRKHHKKESH